MNINLNNYEFKNNNFDIARILLALIVVLAHIAALTRDENFVSYEYMFNSNFAVKGFFTISGFLVAKSYINSKSLIFFAKKRLLRIYPAYIASIFICFLIGTIINRSQLWTYITSSDTIRYIIFNITFLNFLQPTLPNVFTTNPVHALNGSLWTIKIEILLYSILPFLIYFFRRYNQFLLISIIIFTGVAWEYYFSIIYKGPHAEILAYQLPAQLPFFALGVFYFLNPQLINTSKWLALIGLTILMMADSTLIQLAIKPIAFSSLIIYVCTSLPKKFDTTKVGDISYGIYVSHFPIIQCLIALDIFKQSPLVGFILSLLTVLLASYISWNCIEKPFLIRRYS